MNKNIISSKTIIIVTAFFLSASLLFYSFAKVNPTTNKELFKSVVDAFNNRNLDQIEQLFAEKVIFYGNSSPISREVTSRSFYDSNVQ